MFSIGYCCCRHVHGGSHCDAIGPLCEKAASDWLGVDVSDWLLLLQTRGGSHCDAIGPLY